MIKRYKEIDADKSEIARYLGYQKAEPDDAVLKLIKEMTDEQKLYYKELMHGIILADGVIEENEQLAYDNICEFCHIN